MLTLKIRAIVSTALVLSFLAVVASIFGMESSAAWHEIHKSAGWIFIALVGLHLLLNAKIYFAEVRSFFLKK
ncbi:MAG: hypothetical protein V1936_01550 [Patescibacteria group bacterium]